MAVCTRYLIYNYPAVGFYGFLHMTQREGDRAEKVGESGRGQTEREGDRERREDKQIRGREKEREKVIGLYRERQTEIRGRERERGERGRESVCVI